MRPEITAFRELESLVRNLGEQLAGYRRRALTAETKSKEFEDQVAESRAANQLLSGRLAEAEKTRAEVEKKLAAMPAPVVLSPSDGDDPNDDPRIAHLRRENRELLQKLEQARERTTQVVERVRFLRQQMTVEK